MPRILAVALALLFAVPAPAHARSIDREGTVSVLPSMRLANGPTGLDSRGLSPGLTLAFGYKPTSDLRVGIDIGGALARGALGKGRYDITSVPLLLAFDWILLPDSEVRPVLQVAAGKALMAVHQGDYYREYTPTIGQLAAGLQADLSDTLGLLLDGGYLFSRASDPRLGQVDGGGPFVRLGVTFRFEPSRWPR